jgi:hypothetical protein
VSVAVLSAIVVVVLALGFLAYLVAREERRLRRAALRYRELELEGIETLRPVDAMPEFGPRSGTMLLPDGGEADRDALLRWELAGLRRRQHESAADLGRGRDRG